MDHLGQFIFHHWAQCLAFIVVLLLIVVNEVFSNKKRGKELSVTQAVEFINQDEAVVIDLRDKAAFQAGHILHAISATTEDFKSARMEKYKNKPLLLVCARGLQSSQLSAQLKAQGFLHLMVLNGGMSAWQASSLPLVKSKR